MHRIAPKYVFLRTYGRKRAGKAEYVVELWDYFGHQCENCGRERFHLHKTMRALSRIFTSVPL